MAKNLFIDFDESHVFSMIRQEKQITAAFPS